MLEGTLVWSRFSHVYERNDVLAVFHTLNVKVVYLNSQEDTRLADMIRNKSNINTVDLTDQQIDTVRELVDLGFLIASPNTDSLLIEDIRSERTGNVDISLMYLLLTDQCNLACRYCFIEGAIPEEHRFSLMSEDTAKRAIDLFIDKAHICSNPEHKTTIILYGGEPTLNWSVLESVVLYIREKILEGQLPESTEISMVTNGTLLDYERVVFLKQNQVQFAISFDGVGSDSDGRVFHNGDKTVERVLQSFDLLKSCDIPIAVSCTISEYNYKNMYTIAKWLCEQGISSIGFNILMDVPGKPYASDDLIDTAITSLTDCYELFREHGIYEDRIGRKVEMFTNGHLYPFDCGGYGGQFVVAPDGQIGVCHAYLGERKFFDANVQSVQGFDPQTHPHFKEWSRRTPLNMENCGSSGFPGVASRCSSLACTGDWCDDVPHP